jgi:uncharacterized damage-inducible protein DinB
MSTQSARQPSSVPGVMTPEALLEHWQGHRRVTRRVIDAFPEDKLFTFSVGGMRPFGVLALEILTMGAPMVRGVVNGTWENNTSRDTLPKADLLKQWDAATEEINRLWKEIPAERFGETMTAFGQFTDKTHNLLLYVIDNEIHHRGQGYVYLRALDITPPAFYDRS